MELTAGGTGTDDCTATFKNSAGKVLLELSGTDNGIIVPSDGRTYKYEGEASEEHL